MGRTAAGGVGVSSPEAIAAAEQELSDKQGELNVVVEQRREVGTKLSAAEKTVAQLQVELPKALMEVSREEREAWWWFGDRTSVRYHNQPPNLRDRPACALQQEETCARDGGEDNHDTCSSWPSTHLNAHRLLYLPRPCVHRSSLWRPRSWS